MEGPRIDLTAGITSIFDFSFDDIRLLDYQAHPHIAAPIAV
jgi:thymidylate synthase